MGVVVAASFGSRAGASQSARLATALDLLVPDSAQTTDDGRSGPERRSPTLDISAADARLAVAPSESRNWPFASFLTLSLFAHLALYAGLNTQSTPQVAATGEEVITVEIVVGSNSAAGLAETAVPNEEENPIAGQVAQAEVPKEQPPPEAEPPKPVETPPETVVRVEPKPDEVAKADAPKELTLAAEPAKPEETPPETVVRLEPKPDEEIAPTVRPPEPVHQPVVATAAPETPSNPSSGIGHGQSAPNAKYFGEVASHLARRKQYPLDARKRRQQGTGMVKFTIDPAGQVSAIEVVRGTGVAALDREIEAMVRRAAPFPAPPGGVSVSFAAPVSFRIN